ncbi:MAG TPA: signal recognition particle-docking protein FtsY [Chloroflexota bacterium]|nr:signal recognition particle-docking protein FtsY [Chloroflexota bacterium]
MIFDRFRKIDSSLRKTRESFFGRISSVFQRKTIDEDLWGELEELLIRADLGVATTDKLLGDLRDRALRERISDPADLFTALKEELKAILGDNGCEGLLPADGMGVVLVVGVNGVGKTTSIAKLARHWSNQGRNVLLVAGDTFRAGAIDQLKIWGDRVKLPVVSHQPGADPSAVVFDALTAAQARGADLVVVDTAGRLHTKSNLMEELKKIRRVMDKQGVRHVTTLLVVDATTGQNALIQAQRFKEAVEIHGVMVAKLDGTAKGGIVFALADELGVPICYVGTGETVDDLAEFDAGRFVDALLAPAESE